MPRAKSAAIPQTDSSITLAKAEQASAQAAMLLIQARHDEKRALCARAIAFAKGEVEGLDSATLERLMPLLDDLKQIVHCRDRWALADAVDEHIRASEAKLPDLVHAKNQAAYAWSSSSSFENEDARDRADHDLEKQYVELRNLREKRAHIDAEIGRYSSLSCLNDPAWKAALHDVSDADRESNES